MGELIQSELIEKLIKAIKKALRFYPNAEFVKTTKPTIEIQPTENNLFEMLSITWHYYDIVFATPRGLYFQPQNGDQKRIVKSNSWLDLLDKL